MEGYFNKMQLTFVKKALFTSAVIFAISATPAFAAGTNKNTQPVKKVTAPVVSTPVDPSVIVSPGQYLSEIATDNNSTIQRIYDANTEIINPDLIYPGEKLTIPSATEVLTNRPLPTDTTNVDASTTTSTSANVSAAQVSAVPVNASNAGVWQEIANCESGGNWSINTGNGFYGGLQFSLSSWEAVGGVGYPNEASPSEQIALASILQSRQGWGAWPVCSAKIGL